jgi:4-amino-4-deoxy-L-arabinose transferase-like glycosyltransferase
MLSSQASRDAGWMQDERALVAALALWLAVAIVMMATLPALPVDETRYLTVAWEMKLSGNWLLPTLNGEPYSHKPPLYFWLINLVWAVVGSEVWAARTVSVAATAGVIAMTYRLGRELFPERDNATPSLAVLILAGPAVFLYGALLMFDQLLAVWILLGLCALWRAAVKPSWGAWIVLGLALGLGLLTKGPVVLLHLLPPAVLARLWMPSDAKLSFRSWFGPLLVSVVIGAVMILGWAIPAAIVGGPEFAHMIFWKQSAGRMVEAFHHRQPIWFYLPVLAGFLLPLFFWRPWWRALAKARHEPLSRPVRFLLCWLGPAFVAFCLISGKQPHYMLPLMPGVALIAASLLGHADVRQGDARFLAIPFAVLFLVLTLGPPVAAWAGLDSPNGFVSKGLGAFHPLLSLAAGALALLLVLRAQGIRTQALAIAASSALLFATIAVQSSRELFKLYDLAPLGKALDPYKQGPIAVFNQYAGEFGFLARLAHPVEAKRSNELKAWLEEHPDGTAILRHNTTEDPEAGTVIYAQPFRPNKTFSVMRTK